MSLAQDLMGYGLPDKLAIQLASAGNGPVTITAAGSAFSSSTKIQCHQYLVSCTNADGTKALGLPAVGGDNGCLIGDDFIINNAGTTSLQVFASTGILISAGGSNGSQTTVQSHTTMTIFPITSTQ